MIKFGLLKTNLSRKRILGKMRKSTQKSEFLENKKSHLTALNKKRNLIPSP